MLAPAYIDSGGVWWTISCVLQSTFFLGCLSCISFGLLNNSFQLTNENRIAPHSAAAKALGGGGGERNTTLAESPDGEDEWVSHEAIADSHLQLGAL